MKFQPCGTHTLSAKEDILQHQDEVLALRSEQSVLQPGVDVFPKEHAQDDVSALHRKFAW